MRFFGELLPAFPFFLQGPLFFSQIQEKMPEFLRSRLHSPYTFHCESNSAVWFMFSLWHVKGRSACKAHVHHHHCLLWTSQLPPHFWLMWRDTTMQTKRLPPLEMLLLPKWMKWSMFHLEVSFSRFEPIFQSRVPGQREHVVSHLPFSKCRYIILKTPLSVGFAQYVYISGCWKKRQLQKMHYYKGCLSWSRIYFSH